MMERERESEGRDELNDNRNWTRNSQAFHDHNSIWILISIIVQTQEERKNKKKILLEYSLSGPFVSLFFLSSSSLPERKLDCQNINKLFEKVKKSPSKSLDAISFYPYTADIIKNERHSSRRHTQQKWKRNKKEYHERRGAWT